MEPSVQMSRNELLEIKRNALAVRSMAQAQLDKVEALLVELSPPKRVSRKQRELEYDQELLNRIITRKRK